MRGRSGMIRRGVFVHRRVTYINAGPAAGQVVFIDKKIEIRVEENSRR